MSSCNCRDAALPMRTGCVPLKPDSQPACHSSKRRSPVAGNRTDQPLMPRLGFVEVAVVHQGQQREGRIAQPAQAVIPVPGAVGSLWQRDGTCPIKPSRVLRLGIIILDVLTPARSTFAARLPYR